MLTKNRVKQVKWNQLIQNEEKFMLVKEFLFHSMLVRNGNLLKSPVSEIHVKRIRINQGVGVYILSYCLHTFKMFIQKWEEGLSPCASC